MPIASVEEALEDVRQGKPLIVVDDEKRENEGDLVMAAEKVTEAAVNFMITHARGLLCMPVMGERLDQLHIPLMVAGDNTSRHRTAFTVSIDYKNGTSTGISAYDRAATIGAVLDPNAKPEDFVRPGHLFPLRYQDGGVLVRQGHTEAAVDLAVLAGLYPAGIVCEITNPDGSMSRMADLMEFSRVHGLKMITVGQIVAHRRRYEKLINKVAEARLPTMHGDFKLIAYESKVEPGEHVALVMGTWKPEDSILVRIHSECVTGNVFGSLRCDCGQQIKSSLEMISREGRGVFLYMRQEGRGIGLHNKIRAYSLQDNGMDTIQANEELGFESDPRHYAISAQILAEMGVRRVRLLTNNPRKVAGLAVYELEIVERVPMETEVTEENRLYMETKRSKMGHFQGPG